MDDDQFRQLLNHLGLSWTGYRKVRKGVKKRIRRHMQEMGCHNFEGYLAALDSDHTVRSHCEGLMTVSISRFFRDRFVWEALENQLLPDVIEKYGERVKVWFAGCACGEEVFTFSILWDRLQDRFQVLPDLEVLATDMNGVYLKKARKGLFSRSSLREVPEEVRTKYFELQEEGGPYRILPSLKRGISWRLHNILRDPLDRDFHLIFLRNNLLTYYGEEIKRPAFQKVLDCLRPGGFLIIGSHERLPLETHTLVPLSGFSYVFQRKDRSKNDK